MLCIVIDVHVCVQHLSYVLFVGFVQFYVDSDSYHVKKRMKKIIYCGAFGKWFTFLLCGEGIFVIVTLTLSWMIMVVFHFGIFVLWGLDCIAFLTTWI